MPLNCERLKELRHERKLLQKQIAELLGITERHYRSYEATEVDIPVSKAECLADFYKVSVDYLLGRTDKPKWQ